MIVPETDTEFSDQDSLRYESLRCRVLEKQDNCQKGSLGFAMFIRQGMLTWITTWHRYIPENSPTNKQANQSSILPYKVQSEMTKVLANITLFNLEPGEAAL